LGKVLDQIYSTPERDKFRTRLEKGAEEPALEIYISHRGMYEVYANEGKDAPCGSRVRPIPNSKQRCCAG
jgi:outer membrane protein assembly factor BamC